MQAEAHRYHFATGNSVAPPAHASSSHVMTNAKFRLTRSNTLCGLMFVSSSPAGITASLLPITRAGTFDAGTLEFVVQGLLHQEFAAGTQLEQITSELVTRAGMLRAEVQLSELK